LRATPRLWLATRRCSTTLRNFISPFFVTLRRKIYPSGDNPPQLFHSTRSISLPYFRGSRVRRQAGNASCVLQFSEDRLWPQRSCSGPLHNHALGPENPSRTLWLAVRPSPFTHPRSRLGSYPIHLQASTTTTIMSNTSLRLKLRHPSLQLHLRKAPVLVIRHRSHHHLLP
jgi:hypothetical protein